MTKNVDIRFFSPKLFWTFVHTVHGFSVCLTIPLVTILRKKLNLSIVSRLVLSQLCHTKMLNGIFLLNINKTQQ